MKHILAIALLMYFVSTLSYSKNKAVYTDISSIIEKKTKAPEFSIKDVKITCINEQGDIAGTFTGNQTPTLKTIFVLHCSKNGSYTQFFNIGVFKDAIVTGINEERTITINIKTDSTNAFTPYFVKYKGNNYEKLEKSRRYQLSKISDYQTDGFVYGIKGSYVYGTMRFEIQETTLATVSTDLDPKLEDASMTQEKCHIGFIKNVETGLVQYTGFAVNQDNDIKSMSSNGAYCGSSKGFPEGQFLGQACPYFAEKNIRYQLLAGLEGTSTAMNNNGQVVGVWYRENNRQKQGFVWNKADMNNSHDGWRNIYTGLSVYPKSINDEGIVVGMIDANKAFAWKDGHLVFLENIRDEKNKILVDQILDIEAINNKNFIVCTGKINKEKRALIWKYEKIR